MLNEDNPVQTDVVADTAVETGGIARRSFLKGLGGVVAGAAVIASSTQMASARPWNIGTIDTIGEEKLIEMYTTMLKSRHWEEAMKDLFLGGDDDLYGAFHISVGEEATAVGAISALRNDDYIASTHRGHHDLIAKGGDLNKMSAELFFKAGGYNQGFGGSMHITDVSKGILGMNGIVGPSVLLAAGAAYGAKVRGTDQVAMGMVGDGGTNNGWFHDGLRNAALYDLALIAFVQNNGWQISNPTNNTTPIRDLATLAKAYEVPGVIVDGQDVLAVYAVTADAVARARAGDGPTLIESKTYRFYDHSGLAGATIGQLGAFGLPYRSDSDVRAWIANDPIVRYRSTLLGLGVLSEQEADAIVEDVVQQVADSVEFARNSPLPEQDAALSHVYAEGQVAITQFG